MKGRVVLLDQIGDRPAAALLVDGRLEDLLIDPETDAPLTGAIYRAIADRPMKGMGGLFVKLPEGSGFLRQTAGIAPGQRLIVQVTGPAEPGKATPVTTRLLFKSRHAIVTPGAPGLNISRRIKDEEVRAELDTLARAAMDGVPEDFGLILRSAALHAEDDEIAEDIAAMAELAQAVTADLTGGPELLVEGAGAQETANPVVGQAGLCASGETCGRGATQMRADAHSHQVLWLDGAGLVACVLRCQFRRLAFGLGVGDLVFSLFQAGEHVFTAADDPHRLAAPLDRAHFARLQVGHIHLNRCAGCLGPF